MKKIHIKEKGITIITLVITIIILLILAGISIASLVGNDGLINKAKKAKNDYEEKQEEELAMLNEYGNFIDSGKVNDGNNSSDKETSNDKILEKINNLENEMQNLKNTTLTLDTIYPVGSIYISTDLNTAEAVTQKFGGTWESYGQGRTLVGVGTGNDGTISKSFEVSSTGGEYNHTLTINEMPAHSHLFAAVFYTPGVGNLSSGGDLTRGDGRYTGDTGGSQAHNNIQPYITVYMWKRVS